MSTPSSNSTKESRSFFEITIYLPRGITHTFIVPDVNRKILCEMAECVPFHNEELIDSMHNFCFENKKRIITERKMVTYVNLLKEVTMTFVKK